MSANFFPPTFWQQSSCPTFFRQLSDRQLFSRQLSDFTVFNINIKQENINLKEKIKILELNNKNLNRQIKDNTNKTLELINLLKEKKFENKKVKYSEKLKAKVQIQVNEVISTHLWRCYDDCRYIIVIFNI